MKRKIINYFYDGSIEKYKEHTNMRYLVITAIVTTIITTILRFTI